jgi:hypothetical protein
MDLALASVAETLAAEFDDLRIGTVVQVLTECADRFPYDDQHFIEQAARAQLSLQRPALVVDRILGVTTGPEGSGVPHQSGPGLG